VHLILTAFPSDQAIGSQGIATAGSKLKQPSASRELLSSPHLYAFRLAPLHLCNSLRMYTPRFKYTPCVKTGPFYTMCVLCSACVSRVAADVMCRSGMLGLDPATRVLVTGGPYAEAKQVIKALTLRFLFPMPRLLLHTMRNVLLDVKPLQILSLLCAALPDWGLGLEHLVRTCIPSKGALLHCDTCDVLMAWACRALRVVRVCCLLSVMFFFVFQVQARIYTTQMDKFTGKAAAAPSRLPPFCFPLPWLTPTQATTA
jgi:hypothetical protein